MTVTATGATPGWCFQLSGRSCHNSTCSHTLTPLADEPPALGRGSSPMGRKLIGLHVLALVREERARFAFALAQFCWLSPPLRIDEDIPPFPIQ